MWEMAEIAGRLLADLGMSKHELFLKLQEEDPMLHESELVTYLKHGRETPKARRTLEAALRVLTSEKERRNQIVEDAKAALSFAETPEDVIRAAIAAIQGR